MRERGLTHRRTRRQDHQVGLHLVPLEQHGIARIQVQRNIVMDGAAKHRLAPAAPALRTRVRNVYPRNALPDHLVVAQDATRQDGTQILAVRNVVETVKQAPGHRGKHPSPKGCAGCLNEPARGLLLPATSNPRRASLPILVAHARRRATGRYPPCLIRPALVRAGLKHRMARLVLAPVYGLGTW